jgi:hypothetical protein
MDANRVRGATEPQREGIDIRAVRSPFVNEYDGGSPRSDIYRQVGEEPYVMAHLRKKRPFAVETGVSLAEAQSRQEDCNHKR